MGVVLKRAGWFLTCQGRTLRPLRLDETFLTDCLAEKGSAGWMHPEMRAFIRCHCLNFRDLAQEPNWRAWQSEILYPVTNRKQTVSAWKSAGGECFR